METNKKYYVNLKARKPYTCPTCNQKFALKSKFQSHKRVHKELATQTVAVHDLFERPYACNECGKTFSNRKTLLKHLRLHSGVLPLSCSVCNKTFYQVSKWIDHSQVHTGEKLFTCSFCSQTFMKRETFVKHLLTHQLNPLRGRVKSEQSGDVLSFGKETANGGSFEKIKNSSTEESVIPKKHVILHSDGVSGSKAEVVTQYSLFTYGSGYNSFRCSKEQLSNIATDKRLLPRDPYVCQLCLSTFSRKESLKKHELRVHGSNTGTRCTFCEVCFKFFSKKDIMALVDMEKTTYTVPYIAYGSRPHDGKNSVLLVLSCTSCMFSSNRACCLCGKSVRLCDLRTHYKLHTGELVPCEKCGRIFSDNKSLVSHAGTCLALCPICDKAFPDVTALNKHKDANHGRDEDLFRT